MYLILIGSFSNANLLSFRGISPVIYIRVSGCSETTRDNKAGSFCIYLNRGLTREGSLCTAIKMASNGVSDSDAEAFLAGDYASIVG